MPNYTRFLTPDDMPQSVPMEPQQVQNNAGGYVYAISKLDRVRRFLVLGAEGSTYYATERRLVLENAMGVLEAINKNGPAVVKLAVEISVAGRAPKNDPAIFVLALAIKYGNDATRALAYDAVGHVCRIGTHLFTLLESLKQLHKGESRGLRSALQKWYLEREPSALAFQVIKYQQRQGWSHRDVLRLAHPKTADAERGAVFQWATKGWAEVGNEAPAAASLRSIWAMERLRRETSEAEVVRLVAAYRLPFESVPTEWLKSAGVWTALLPNLGFTAMVRNLGRMTANGCLTALSPGVALVVERLSHVEALRKARVHPVQLLSALKTYEQGHGERGSLRWEPIGPIVDALNAAFYTSFDMVEPCGKRWLLGLDISGSMWAGVIAGVPGLTPAVATAAMAMVTLRREAQTHCLAFTAKPEPVQLSASQRLDDVLRTTQALSSRMGRTDCAVPMLYALERGIQVDVFVIYTDNETWSGNVHPMEALRRYRKSTGINARLIVVGMTATQFSIADPQDPDTLDVVGFDSSAPALMSNFVNGSL
jgi:60 kDa SS-A/Ro ribonucleoprotein